MLSTAEMVQKQANPTVGREALAVARGREVRPKSEAEPGTRSWILRYARRP